MAEADEGAEQERGVEVHLDRLLVASHRKLADRSRSADARAED
jgi:hypothetical protein